PGGEGRTPHLRAAQDTSALTHHDRASALTQAPSTNYFFISIAAMVSTVMVPSLAVPDTFTRWPMSGMTLALDAWSNFRILLSSVTKTIDDPSLTHFFTQASNASTLIQSIALAALALLVAHASSDT